MSLWFSVIFILGIMLGGLLALVLFSLMAMARKGEESLDQLELEMRRTQACSSPPQEKAETR